MFNIIIWGYAMNNFKYLTIFSFLTVGLVFADNPGEDMTSAPVAAPAQEAVVETTVAETTVDTSDDSEATEASGDSQDLGRVSVTGSRIKRTDIEGATPLITITKDDIRAQGFQTVFDAVSNLTQNTGSVNGENFQAGFLGYIWAPMGSIFPSCAHFGAGPWSPWATCWRKPRKRYPKCAKWGPKVCTFSTIF